jgi:hypothetical protein
MTDARCVFAPRIARLRVPLTPARLQRVSCAEAFLLTSSGHHMSTIHPAALAARRKYWTRPDAYRFAAPEAKMPSWLDPSATRVRRKEAQEEEARARAVAEQEAFEREVLALRHDFAKLKLEYELDRFQRKYSPNQPRVPAGSPDGGQWTSGGGGAQLTDISAAKKLAPLVKAFGKWTARQFVSRYCRGSINRELPGQFENVTIADIYEMTKGGDARARACFKLLNEPRFRK